MTRTLALATLVLGLFASCSKHESAPASATAQSVVPVRTAPVVAVELPVLTEITGSVRATQRATLAAKITGAISRLPVTLGQSVAAGDLLLEISSPEIAARLDQARAQLNLTERELARERALLARGVTPPEAVRSLEDRLAIHAAQLHEAETLLGYAKIRAPFAGMVAQKYVDAGDLAQPGQPLVELDGVGAFEISASIPDSLSGPIAIGQFLAATIPSSGRRFDAQITEISSATDPSARAVALKLAVPADTGVRPGQFVRLAIPGSPTRTLLVPASAVTRLGQMERVFVVNADQRAALRLVKTGAVRGDHLEILSGLDTGETVIVSPGAELREGVGVEVQP